MHKSVFVRGKMTMNIIVLMVVASFQSDLPLQVYIFTSRYLYLSDKYPPNRV